MKPLNVCIAFLIYAGCVWSENANLVDRDVIANANNEATSQILGHLVSISDRLNSLEQRLNAVDHLKANVDFLISQYSDKNSQVLHDLRAVCAELPVVNGASKGSTENQIEIPTTPAPWTPFRVTRVEKIEIIDHYRVKVMYEGSVQPLTMVSMGFMSTYAPLSDQGKLGLVEFSVPKDPPKDMLFINFHLPENMIKLHLKMNNTPNEFDIPRLSFKISPGNDITFKSGQSPTADFTFTVDGDMDAIDEDTGMVYILAQSDTNVNVLNRYHGESPAAPAQLHKIHFGGQKGNRYGRVMLNSTNDVDCIIQVEYGVRFSCPQRCLVPDYYATMMVRVYREDHDASFNKDFIAFIHDELRFFGTRFVCQVGGSACVVYCEATGSSISSIDIARVKPTGTGQQTESYYSTKGVLSFAAVYIANATLEDAGDFMCTVRSDTKEIREILTLEVIKKAKIDRDLSTVTKFDNGSALVTCVADGTPRPNVTFDVDNLNNHSYVIHETHPSDTQTKLEMFIDDYEAVRPSYVDGFPCGATNVERAYIFGLFFFSDGYRVPNIGSFS